MKTLDAIRVLNDISFSQRGLFTTAQAGAAGIGRHTVSGLEKLGNFVLKGGSGLLARIPDARSTRDIDFATSSHESPESALAALDSLAARDMGDFLIFKLTKYEESLGEFAAFAKRNGGSSLDSPRSALRRPSPRPSSIPRFAIRRTPRPSGIPRPSVGNRHPLFAR